MPVADQSLVLAVMFCVGFRGLGGVVFGMGGVAVRRHGVVSGLLMVFAFMMFGRLAVMFGGGLVMVRGRVMVFYDFCDSHWAYPY